MTATYWLIIGFIGQVAFGARFVIQWIVSEKKRREHHSPSILVLQHYWKCDSFDLRNLQRGPGIHSWSKPWFYYLYPKFDSY